MKEKKIKQIAAIVGIVLLLSMYVISFIVSFFATEAAPGLFLACVFSTVVIPIMIYMFIAVYKYVHRDDNQKDKDEDTPKEVKE
jgi:amino acid permease